MNQEGYPYSFVGIDKALTDKYLLDTLVYRFESLKSHHVYEVHIERYVEHLCCVKFFDKTTDVTRGKFSQLSGTYEPRTIFQTIADIALDAFRRDPDSSFFFIGASDKRDVTGSITRRYRVYTAFIKDLGIEAFFEPYLVDAYSMCVMVNKKSVADMDGYMQRILNFLTT